jgi:hypothetical protein
LIAQHQMLQQRQIELIDQQRSLQADIDRLLKEHQRLMQAAKSIPQSNWFEGAGAVLSQIAASPDPAAINIMQTSLIGLLQRLTQIRGATPR